MYHDFKLEYDILDPYTRISWNSFTPKFKLSLSQLVKARKKTNTNLRRNVCEPQLRYIPKDALAFLSLSAVRSVKTDLTLKCCF